MALLTLEGVYRDGKVELVETPDGLDGESRVLVTFLPVESETRPVIPPQSEEEREALVARIAEQMRRGLDFGGQPYPKREELYDRVRRIAERDG